MPDNQADLTPSARARALSIDVLDQPIRVKNILNNIGLYTLGDICGNSREECEKTLSKFRYFVARGRHSELPSLLDELERLGVWNNGTKNHPAVSS